MCSLGFFQTWFESHRELKETCRSFFLFRAVSNWPLYGYSMCHVYNIAIMYVSRANHETPIMIFLWSRNRLSVNRLYDGNSNFPRSCEIYKTVKNWKICKSSAPFCDYGWIMTGESLSSNMFLQVLQTAMNSAVMFRSLRRHCVSKNSFFAWHGELNSKSLVDFSVYNRKKKKKKTATTTLNQGTKHG